MGRRFRITIAALSVIVVQSAIASPSRTVAGLRALTCCAMNCHHASSLADAMRCCEGTSSPDEVAVCAGKSVQPVPTYASLAVASVVAPRPVLTREFVEVTHPPRRAPIFLATRSLRL